MVVMLERFKSLFKDMPAIIKGSGSELFDADDPRLAAAALLIHIMTVDGEKHTKERQRLEQILIQSYGIKGSEVVRFIAKAENANREMIDFSVFTDVLNQHFNEDEKRDFIRLMWEMVYADGDLHENEDCIMWRITDLMGIKEPELSIAQKAAKSNDI